MVTALPPSGRMDEIAKPSEVEKSLQELLEKSRFLKNSSIVRVDSAESSMMDDDGIQGMTKDPEKNTDIADGMDMEKKASKLEQIIPEKDSRGHNVTILTRAVYAMYHKYRARSFLDLTCRQNAEWIGHLVKIIGEENESFRYYCIEEDEDLLKETIPLFRGFQNIYFMKRDLTTMRFPNNPLALAIDLFPRISNERSLEILKNIKKNGIQIFVSTTTAGRPNLPLPSNGTSRAVNLRAGPYRLGTPSVVFDEIMTDPSNKLSPLQLILWEVDQAFPYDVQRYQGFN